MNNNLYSDQNYIPNQGNIPINNYQTMYDQGNYVEGLLKQNIGKEAMVHASFADSTEWRDSIFTGRIQGVGKDYVLIYDNKTNNTYLIWSVYIDYISFKENINLIN